MRNVWVVIFVILFTESVVGMCRMEVEQGGDV